MPARTLWLSHPEHSWIGLTLFQTDCDAPRSITRLTDVWATFWCRAPHLDSEPGLTFWTGPLPTRPPLPRSFRRSLHVTFVVTSSVSSALRPLGSESPTRTCWMHPMPFSRRFAPCITKSSNLDVGHWLWSTVSSTPSWTAQPGRQKHDRSRSSHKSTVRCPAFVRARQILRWVSPLYC